MNDQEPRPSDSSVQGVLERPNEDPIMIKPLSGQSLQRERLEWKRKVEQTERTLQERACPTVDEEFLVEAVKGQDVFEEEVLQSWKSWNPIDNYSSYEVEPSSSIQKDDLILEVGWSKAVEDEELRNRLNAQDTQDKIPEDPFTQEFRSTTSKMVDFVKSRHPGMVSYNIEISPNHSAIYGVDNVVMKPSEDWIEERRRKGEDTEVI